jgi:hypothetical protein
MKKNRKVTYVRPPTPQEMAKLAWRDFEWSLFLVLAASMFWGPVYATWPPESCCDLWYIFAWTMSLGSPAALFSSWVIWSVGAAYLEWHEADRVVQAIPRNRRIRPRS